MTRDRAPLRAAFTLIELLVVIAIIATLTAITVAGVSRVRSAQQSRNTEQTLTKLQGALEQQWKAVLDQCGQDRLGTGSNSATRQNFQNILTTCSNDPDLAQSVWTYMNLVREFPQTFSEATTALTFGGVTLQPRKCFGAVAGGSASDQAAVLLYLNLSEKGNRGSTFAADDVTAGAQGNLGNYRVFTDAWGTPITFVRFANYTELQSPPFVNSNNTAKGLSLDPIDPLKKLANWTNASTFLTVLNQGGATPATALSQNKLITVISAGPNGPAQQGGPPPGFEGNPTGTTDDVYGYRLVRLGKRGD